MAVKTFDEFSNYINGGWVPSSTKEGVTNRNPADLNDIVGSVQKSSAEDLEQAVTAAS